MISAKKAIPIVARRILPRPIRNALRPYWQRAIGQPEELVRLREVAARFNLSATVRGYDHWRLHSDWCQLAPVGAPAPDHVNPLLQYFNEHKEGHGVWKFIHYFEAYERYFSRFRGKETHVLEIGVYSGGSLEMWQNYLGPQCKVYGVDIEPRCKAYEGGSVRIFIGDQADRNFWKHVKQEVPVLDIVIDDGGHEPEQQIVTLEELLPHLRPAGIYLCEDVTTSLNQFAAYVCGFAQNINSLDWERDFQPNYDQNERRQVCKTTPFQSAVASVHLYPFLTVIERTLKPVSELVAPKHGTEWEPFIR